MEYISYFIIPIIIVMVSIILLISKHDMFGEFLIGARDGLETGVKLLPTLVVLMVGISMFNSSGAVDFIVKILEPFGNFIGIPIEILPLLIVRPISGSASTAMINELFAKYGADSFAGQCASVIMGSSDTIIYVIAVYFSSINIKKTRHALPAAFLTMVFCIFFSCFVCRFFFNQQ